MKYITYFRVSTKQQGKSGLGLDAQRSQVAHYVAGRPGAQILGEYTEIESGKTNDRAQLRQAINQAKNEGAILLVAKLDRLSRDVAFIFALKAELERARVDFAVCDMPEANTLTLGIMASLAQHERELISKRTKAGLAEAKKRGTKLGTPGNLTDDARNKAHKAIRDKAINNQALRFAFHYIKPLRDAGTSYQVIADKLNAEGYRTTEGREFHASQVRRIFARHNGQK
jgi:DNA invertase Pin-like site-specific DNA recombinase